MDTRDALDQQYIDFCIKFKDAKALKGSSKILKQFNLEIYDNVSVSWFYLTKKCAPSNC